MIISHVNIWIVLSLIPNTSWPDRARRDLTSCWTKCDRVWGRVSGLVWNGSRLPGLAAQRRGNNLTKILCGVAGDSFVASRSKSVEELGERDHWELCGEMHRLESGIVSGYLGAVWGRIFRVVLYLVTNCVENKNSCVCVCKVEAPGLRLLTRARRVDVGSLVSVAAARSQLLKNVVKRI